MKYKTLSITLNATMTTDLICQHEIIVPADATEEQLKELAAEFHNNGEFAIDGGDFYEDGTCFNGEWIRGAAEIQLLDGEREDLTGNDIYSIHPDTEQWVEGETRVSGYHDADGDFVAMTFCDWSDKFQPIGNHISDGQGFDDCLFETNGAELDFVIEFGKENPERVWTIIQGDDGELYTTNGFHFVNRFGYLLTSVDAVEGCQYEIL